MEISVHSCLIQLLNTVEDTYIDSIVMSHISDYENEILINKVKKAFSLQKRKCVLSEAGRHNELLMNYNGGSLKPFADSFGRDYFELKKNNSAFNNTYLIYLDVRVDDVDCLLIIDNLLKTCISHNTEFVEAIENHLVEFKSVLPKDITAGDRFILFDYLNKDLQIYEANDARDLFEKMFDLDSSPSTNEAFKVFESKVIEVCQNNDIPISDCLPDFKIAFVESSRVDSDVIAKEVFSAYPVLQDEFKLKVKSEGIKEDYYIPHDEVVLPKRNRTMKYVTESGIEIIVPANIVKRKDKVEIISNPDGTTSIEIKNISKLKNK